MKPIRLLVSTALIFVLAACGANGESKDEYKEPGVQKAEPITSIEHMHGLTYSQDGKMLYIATHDGLMQSSVESNSWSRAGNLVIDLMGFNVRSDGTMITSGHPGPGMDLPQPLGVMKSKDQGKSWEPVSLQGKIDFHILVPNPKQPDILFGLNQMGEGEYGAGIFKSTDGGVNWEKILPQGLPEDLHKVLSIYSYPNQPDTLLAGTETGLLKSGDAGKTWIPLDAGRIVTAMQWVSNTENDILGYAITKDERGLMISKDGGSKWEKLGLDLGEDAISYLSINPSNQQQMAAATFGNSVYVSQDGGKEWNAIIEKGKPKK